MSFKGFKNMIKYAICVLPTCKCKINITNVIHKVCSQSSDSSIWAKESEAQPTLQNILPPIASNAHFHQRGFQIPTTFKDFKASKRIQILVGQSLVSVLGF